jgi:hypothetical protein
MVIHLIVIIAITVLLGVIIEKQIDNENKR